MKGLPQSGAALTILHDAPNANTNATKTITAATNDYWSIQWLTASFDVTHDVVKLSISFASTDKWAVDIPVAAGVFHFTFPGGLWQPTKNQEVIILLAADSGGAKGKISLGYL